MAALISQLFRGNPRLERCLIDDAAHVVIGDRGPFVALLQYALLVLEGGTLSDPELDQETYGQGTAQLVLAYKTRRKIINPDYQTKPDNIVGKMTIRSLDAEMAAFEAREQVTVGRSF